MNTSRFLQIAAAAAFLLIGFFTGKSMQQPTPTPQEQAPADDREQFILILQEDTTFASDNIPALVEEYTAWAMKMHEADRLVSAEKLRDERVHLGNVAPANSLASGYFVIWAKTAEEALEIAKTHPHLKYNGGIELRQIEKL